MNVKLKEEIKDLEINQTFKNVLLRILNLIDNDLINENDLNEILKDLLHRRVQISY